MTIRMVLKRKWDDPEALYSAEHSFFSGRKFEADALVNFLSRKTSSSALVVGHRGSGKTSLIKHVIQRIKNKNPLTIPVYINAPHFMDENGIQDSKGILRVIATSLYKSKADYKLPKKVLADIDLLYKKVVASEFEDKISEKRKRDLIISESINENVSTNTKFDLKLLMTIITIFVVGAISLNLIADWMGTVVALMSIIVAGTVEYKRVKVVTDTLSNVNSADAETYYKFDNSLISIEMDLDQIHDSLRKNHYKVVYIIDEADKIENEKHIDKMFSAFKNFFTLSNSNFLFVTSEEIIKSLQTLGERKRDKRYTYFNSQFYVARPNFQDLEAYLKNITDMSESSESENLSILYGHLIYKAKADFFDLTRVIQNHISSYEDDKAIIEITTSYFHNKVSLNDKLYRCIKLVFSDRYYSHYKEKWENNESIVHTLFNFLADTFSFKTTFDYSNDGGKYEFYARRDLGKLLYRIDFVKVNSLNPDVRAPWGENIKSTSYLPSDNYVADVPEALEFRSVPEEKFIKEFLSMINLFEMLSKICHDISPKSNFGKLTSNIINSLPLMTERYGYLGLNVDFFVEGVSTYLGLHEVPPSRYANDIIEESISKQQQNRHRVYSFLHDLISNVFLIYFRSIRDTDMRHILTTANLNKILPGFDPNLTNRLVKQPNHLLQNITKKRHIVFVSPENADFFSGINKNSLRTENSECMIISIQKHDSPPYLLFFRNGTKIDFNKANIDAIKEWFLQE